MNNGIDCIGIAVSGIIIHKNKVCLLKRKISPDVGNWCLPGGKLKRNETVENAILREVKEEINCKVSIKQLLGISNYVNSKENMHWVTIIYELSICRDNSCNPTNAEKDQHEAMEFFDFRTLPSNIAESSLYGLMLYYKKKCEMSVY